ncbi:MAG: DNA translocase FtsK [Dehalococcoidia bacterium]|nr:DNA translocase FtsK [Dehalococcoidia bacterium]
MAKTARRSSHSASRAPLIDHLVEQARDLAPWIGLALVISALAAIGFALWQQVHYALAGMGLLVVAVPFLAWRNPRGLLRRANWITAATIVALVSAIALSMYQKGWGGNVGDEVADWPAFFGGVTAAFGLLLAFAVAFPRLAWRCRGPLGSAAGYGLRWSHNGFLAAQAWLFKHEAAPPEGAAEPETGGEAAAPTPQSKNGRFPFKRKASGAGAPQAAAAKEPARATSKGANGNGGWKLPPMSLLLEEPQNKLSEEENLEKARLIEQTLADYGVEVEVQEIRPGPVVTQFGLVPGWVRRVREVKDRDKDGHTKLDKSGKPIVVQIEEKSRVRVDTILAREKDLAMALAAKSLRFEAPVPGEAFVGLEVPNKSPATVTLQGVMQSPAFKALQKSGNLPIALGKGAGGEAVVADLTAMPHLLIAGATGSGKSVCMNTIIGSLLMQMTPLHVRMVMTDPKRVELTPYNGTPHLALPVIVESDQAVPVLRGAITEMKERFKALEAAGARNIQGYNKNIHSLEQRMPYLVVVIDELADLMMAASVDVEHSLCRLAQLGRAVGIHLVVATQRPSVDVITGLIKANFPSRISFAVTSQVDSRTILDGSGAEKLLGRGDMLYAPIGAPKPKRIQGAYVSDNEITQLTQFWRDQHGTPVPPIALVQEEGGENQEDELLSRAKELAQTHGSLSASLLQRKLGVGYPRAARLLDRLEELDIVLPAPQGKPRQVVPTDHEQPVP